ncbi:MAG: M20/M25/M40 family metallo-hydrolase [Acidobacteriota bacterium]
MKKHFYLFLILLLLFIPFYGEEKKVEFDSQQALNYIKALASDEMEGRKSGQPGAVMAEEYIATKFNEWDLEPAGDKGTYFQNFTIEHSHVEEGVVLEVISPRERRSFYYGEDWRVQRYSGSGSLVGEIVFAGYGIHASDKDYDDYEGMEVGGKFILLTEGAPTKLQAKLREESSIQKKIEAAQKLGAAGVILFQQPSSQSRYFRLRADKEIHNPDFILLSVESKVVEFILKDLPIDLRTAFSRLNRESQPQSLCTGVKTFVSVRSVFDPQRSARNVLAKITGSDQKLKEEYIILGAHMDHLGINPMGDIMNGANDNASGSAVVMEVARTMKQSGFKPKRTVVFALWAGEEQGLLGSRHYADNPTIPIEKAVVNINLDMVGIGSAKISLGGKYYGPDIWAFLEEKLPPEIMEYLTPGRGGPGGSDHTPFLMKGVPAFFAITEDSFLKYHHCRDEYDLIQPELLKKSGDFVYSATAALANELRDFIKPLREETFQLRYLDLVNYRLSPLENILNGHGNSRDSHVDIQMSLLQTGEDLSADQTFLGLLEKIVEGKKKANKTEGLVYYSLSNRIANSVRQGKTTVVSGLNNIKLFQENPHWAAVLADQGACFVSLDSPSVFFDGNSLSEEGKEYLKALNSSGLLLMLKNSTEAEVKIILQELKKPVVFLTAEVPDKNILELVKKNDGAVGLLLGEESPESYFQKLDSLREEIGTSHLMIVNEGCLWEEAGQNQMLQVISKLLEAEYERNDLSNIFSGTLLRILSKVRREGDQTMPFRPF